MCVGSGPQGSANRDILASTARRTFCNDGNILQSPLSSMVTTNYMRPSNTSNMTAVSRTLSFLSHLT